MIINNKKKAIVFKRIFFLVSVIIALAALALFLLDFTIYGIGAVGVFSLWFLYFQVADYHFIDFKIENRNIILRYYKAIKLGKSEFNSIEFPQELLKNAYFENSMFGKMSDLTLVVKTKRGIAEYPSVSLSALSKEEKLEMKAALFEILNIA